jgi:STAS-like domain of unknown function (DUF4325)
MTTPKPMSMHQMFGENLLNPEDGSKLCAIIRSELLAKRDVVLDFAGVRIVASAFLNAAIGELYADVPEDVIKEHLSVPNLSDIGKFALKRVVDNSKRYYSDARYRNAVDASASNFLEA